MVFEIVEPENCQAIFLNPCFMTLNLEWRICYSWLTWNSLDSKNSFLTFSPVCQGSSLWQNFNPFMSSFLSPGPDLISRACGSSLVFDSLQSCGLYVAHHAPLSMEFSWQEYRSVEWAGLPFLGNLPAPGIKSASPALAGEFFTALPPGKPDLTPQPPLEEVGRCLFTCRSTLQVTAKLLCSDSRTRS